MLSKSLEPTTPFSWVRYSSFLPHLVLLDLPWSFLRQPSINRQALVLLVISLWMIFVFPAALQAKSSVRHMDLLGTWVSEKPGKMLKFYMDNTLFLRTANNKFYRGILVLQPGHDPMFFLLINNHRILCPFVSLHKNILTIGGNTQLSGKWHKKNNDFRSYW